MMYLAKRLGFVALLAIAVAAIGAATPSRAQETAATYRLLLPLVRSAVNAQLANGNFEAGRTDWAELGSYSAIIRTSFPGSVRPHGGSRAVWLGGIDSSTTAIQQQVTVGEATPTLSYWRWIASAELFCGFDRARVLVNGAPVESFNLCDPNDTRGWVKRTVNLGAYAGKSVLLRFEVSNSASLNSNLFIDDVAFQSGPALAAAEDPGIVAERDTAAEPSAPADPDAETALFDGE
jgi:hypothetical protein